MASAASKRAPDASRVSRTEIVPMIRGTVAALRCRELIADGCKGEARVELSLLRSAISELAVRPVEQLGPDLDVLRAREKTLAALLAVPATVELAARQPTSAENIRPDFRFSVPHGSIDTGGPQVRTRNDTPAESKPAEPARPAEPVSRRQPTSRTNAMLLVERGNGEEQVRLIDFLSDYAGEADTFEQVGALTIGQSLEISGGDGSPVRIRRIQ